MPRKCRQICDARSWRPSGSAPGAYGQRGVGACTHVHRVRPNLPDQGQLAERALDVDIRRQAANAQQGVVVLPHRQPRRMIPLVVPRDGTCPPGCRYLALSLSLQIPVAYTIVTSPRSTTARGGLQ